MVLAEHRLGDTQTTASLGAHAPHQQRAREAQGRAVVSWETQDVAKWEETRGSGQNRRGA